MTDIYYKKYLKYKNKYINLKKLLGANTIIYDLSNNQVIQPTSSFITLGIESQKSIVGESIANKATQYCEHYNNSKDALKNIVKFTNTYKIKPNTIVGCENISDVNADECWKKFKTPNDFFIRKIH